MKRIIGLIDERAPKPGPRGLATKTIQIETVPDQRFSIRKIENIIESLEDRLSSKSKTDQVFLRMRKQALTCLLSMGRTSSEFCPMWEPWAD